MGGYIQIGTSESPFLHKAIITMHGSRQDTQLPLYGNKVWALQDTTLEINGEPRNFLRSTLSSTVLKEQNTITVKDKVDWNVGDQIVIASSDYIHSHAEVRYIKSIAGNSIVLNKPLNYQHYSSIDKYGNTDFPMETEVALLTRNIVFQGFIDKDSRRYGAHIYSSNQDSTVKISYCEFKNVGQANILDRYPINIHNIENAADSYLIGNSIHNSYARAINIYNTNNLRVRNNLAYFIFGSAFVLESGLEANNIIDNNLGISIMQSWTLHNIDTTPAVFYISSPKNVIINNSAAGGDWAGFQYDLSDVSSLDPYICPSGAKLLKFSNNIAHSNAKFGLYIYKYIPRNMPCNPSLNLRANDWLLDNPGIKTVFNNFIAFSNRENGVVAEYVGNLVFDNFLIADSVLAGIQISDTKNTYIDGMILSNSVLVGLSLNKINNQENSKNIAGLITPRSDNLLVFNVSFYNFTFAQSMTAITTCSKCNSYKLLITGGKTTKFELLNFINVDRRILWGGYKKEVFLDIDGSLTNLKNSMITSFYPHLDGIAQCNRTDAAILDDSILCNSSVQIRTLIFRNLAGARSFVGLELKVYRIPDLQFNVSGNLTLNSSKFTKDVMKSVWQDTPYSWSLPFVTGHIYNVHWHNGNMDFTKMNLRPSLYWNSQDKSIILKFNCSDYKDDYNVKILQLNGTKNNVSKVQNFNSFSSGDYSFSNISNDFIIGINGNNNGSIDINTIRIAPIINDTQNLNDTQNQNETRNTTTIKPDWDNIRYWSNASLWPNKMVPLDGEDVLIEADWVMYLDVDTANLGTLIIDGFMSCKSTSKLQLRAERIWVRNGYLTAGNATNPYPYPLEIILIGGKSSSDLVIDSFINSGNKILAVTGKLDLYGLIPSKTSTRLSNIISKGDTSIDLIEAVDWNIGWEILIGPTEKSSNEYEKKVISDIINGGKTLVLAEPIEFFHYGSNNFAYISDEGSHLDMRAVVGVLSRNIRIKGDKQENLGCNILVYQYTDEYSGRIRRGNINFEGVEISFCGQSDTERAALDIKYIKKGSISSVRGSTIHDGFGWGLNVFSSNSLIFEQNIISNCQKYLAKFSFSNNFSFSRNLLIGARNRNLSSALNLYDMVAGFSMESAISGNSNFVVHHNIIQGSQGNGFVVPGFKCDDNLNTFVFNSANSIEHAGVILLGNNSYCLELRNLTIFTSKYAVLSNFEAQGIVLKSMIFAENIFGPFIMYSNEGMDNRIIYKDVVFIAIARDNCPECYAENTSCSNSKAIILPIVTISGNGKSLPLYKSPFGLVTLDSDAAFDQQLFIENVRFINYKMNYTDGDNKNFFSCHSNVIFKMRDSAPDASASVQIANTKLVNSETASFFSLTSPSSSLTGCGNHMCTGENNWLFTDMDGLFLGSKSQIIPLNSGIYDARCNQNLKWNGQICSGYNFGILQFENNGADQRTRPIAPVSLSSLHMRNKLNQWKEWQWEGQTPRNRRLSRFHGLVELNVSVTAGFEVTVPESMKFRLESKDVNDFVLLNIVYERPNVIEVWNAVSSKFITPFRANQTNLLDEKANCGANIYDSNLNKISFILTGGKNCILTIRTVDSVKITMRMETTLDDFYKNNGEATFFDKMSTFLGIDFSRIRIANIRSGSVIIDFHIVENRTFEKGTSSSESILKNPNDTLKVDQLHFDTKNREFNHIMDQLANVTSDENNTLGLPWQVLDMKTEPVINNPNNLTVNNNNQTTNESSSIDWGAVNSTNNETIVASVRDNDNGDGKLTLEFIIALSVIIPSLLIILIIGCCCINIRGGSSLFKIIVQKIFGKQEELSSRAIRYSGDFRNVKINQIVK